MHSKLIHYQTGLHSATALSGLNFLEKIEDHKLNLKSWDKIGERTIFLSDGEDRYSIQLNIPILFSLDQSHEISNYRAARSYFMNVWSFGTSASSLTAQEVIAVLPECLRSFLTKYQQDKTLGSTHPSSIGDSPQRSTAKSTPVPNLVATARSVTSL